MQNVLGYPILTAGMLLGSRGVGTLFAMLAVGRLMKFVEPRYLVLAGLLLTAVTLYEMIGFTADTSTQHHRHDQRRSRASASACVFVPLNTVAFATLPAHLRTDGTAILTLVRNVGSSIGISIVIANLTSTTTRDACAAGRVHHAVQRRAADAGRARSLNTGDRRGPRAARQHVTQQATIIAYANDFKLLMGLTSRDSAGVRDRDSPSR